MDLLSIQNIRRALWPIWHFIQWMLWILPQRWRSWCMRLITHLYHLLRLQISAVVTVLPMYVFMVYTGTSLPFTIVLKEWLLVCSSVLQKMRAVLSYGTVCHSAVLCCVRTHNVIWSVSNIEAWKPLCMWLFLLCIAHLLFLSLAF